MNEVSVRLCEVDFIGCQLDELSFEFTVKPSIVTYITGNKTKDPKKLKFIINSVANKLR